MDANKNETHLCAHIHLQGPEVNTRPRASQGVGLAMPALEHVVLHAYTNEISHKPLTYIQRTVNLLRIEHLYRYATLLLGVRVCLEGVRIDT